MSLGDSKNKRVPSPPQKKLNVRNVSHKNKEGLEDKVWEVSRKTTQRDKNVFLNDRKL